LLPIIDLHTCISYEEKERERERERERKKETITDI